MMKQPQSLQYQCITKLKRIVCELVNKELIFPHTIPYIWLREQIISIPPNLVNEAVAQILSALDILPVCYEQCSKERAILDKVISTILHPNMTELVVFPYKLTKENSFSLFPINTEDEGKCFYIVPILCKHLFTLSKLKVINLPSCYVLMTPYPENGHLPQLQSFTYHHDCTNELLECIVRSSISLKQVDVQFSRRVTDESIDSILRLHDLEHLNISETRITSKGLKKLVNSDIIQQLRFLGVSVDSVQPLLVNSARMTQLRSLLLYRFDQHEYRQVEQFIENLSKQLVNLSLPAASPKIMKTVRENSIKLELVSIKNAVGGISIDVLQLISSLC